MNLNAELFRQLSYIANDEDYMRKAVNFIKKLAKKKEEESYKAKTKAEIQDDLNEMCQEIKLARKGIIKGRPAEELLNEL